MKKTLPLLICLSLMIGLACGNDDPMPAEPTTVESNPQLDSISHSRNGGTWTTYFSFDDQDRLTFVTGSDYFAVWKQAFQYEGNTLSQILRTDPQGDESRDSMVYNMQNQIAEIYYYRKLDDGTEILSSLEVRTYDDMG